MSSPQPPPRPLAGLLGSGFPILIGVGWSLGVAPLAAPGLIAAHFDQPVAYAALWVGGLLYALLAAAAFAGGDARGGGYYAVVGARLGDYPAFAVGIAEWVAICGASGAAAQLAGNFAIGLVPAARAGEVIALGIVLVLTGVVWSGRRAGGAIHTIAVLFALAGVVAFAAGAFWLGTRSPIAPAAISADRDGAFVPALLLAMLSAAIAMSGWAGPLYAGGEGRRLGRRIAAAAIVIAAVHALANLAMLRVVSLPTIAGSELALEVAAGRLLGGAYDGVRVLLIVVMIGAVSAGVVMAPRVLHAMAHDRLVPRALAAETAVLVSGAAVALFVFTGGFLHVMAALAVLLVAAQLAAFASVLADWRVWDRTRTAALLGAVCAASMLAGIVATRPLRALPLLLMVATLPVCYAMRRRGARSRASLDEKRV